MPSVTTLTAEISVRTVALKLRLIFPGFSADRRRAEVDGAALGEALRGCTTSETGPKEQYESDHQPRKEVGAGWKSTAVRSALPGHRSPSTCIDAQAPQHTLPGLGHLGIRVTRRGKVSGEGASEKLCGGLVGK